ncbi:hypothetical protein [Morganella morganii]|uniref:hypothetical protein n=1 Tax=Morganella morganii TaxID=582 RepID=UPI00189B2A0F|nr:hypothetical protein [Morganella morganii]
MEMLGVCIKCGQYKELIHSHVISKFIGKRIYLGPKKSGGFNLFSGYTMLEPNHSSYTKKCSWKFGQDLPKPFLMCKLCDGSFSAQERLLSQLIDTSKLFDSPALIYSSQCLIPSKITGLEDFQEYQLPENEQRLLRRNGIITCWRALHATARSSSSKGGITSLNSFLESARGTQMNYEVIKYFDSESAPEPGHFALFLAPSALTIELSGSQGVAPHGWDVIIFSGKDHSDAYMVAVWFGCWMLLWAPEKTHHDPTVASIVAEIRMSQVATTWPLTTLKPRVDNAIDQLEKRNGARLE